MNYELFTCCLLVAGECCLLLDLGNRLFGSYSRTLTGMLSRMILVVLSCIALAIPLLIWLLCPETTLSSSLLWSSSILSLLVIIIFLLPYRFGIRKIPPPVLSQSKRRLNGSIDLHKVELEGQLPETTSAVKCLVLSDLHCNTQAKLETISLAVDDLKKDAQYDLVLVLGDLGEKHNLIPDILNKLSSVNPRHGIFLVRSNHDCEHKRRELIARDAKELSITLLSNSTHAIEALGISLVGLEYPWIKGPLPEVERTLYSIGLTHTPDNITYFRDLGVSFAIAGHTHGGKFRLPLIGSILVPSRFGRFLDRGWFKLGKTIMHLTSGIGYFPGVMGKRGTILELTIKNRTY